MGNPWDYDFTAIGKRAVPLVILVGSDDDALAKQSGGFRILGNSDIYQLIPETFPFEQINLSRQFLKQHGKPDLAPFACVLNLVSDPDQHPRTLELIRKLLRGYRGRILNRPEAVLRSARDQVARRLAGIENLRVPKVLRLRNPKPGTASAAAARAGLAFPLIARQAGTHTGYSVGLVEDAAQLDLAVGGKGDFFLTEFVDFRSGDGLYRKYRFWSLGRTTIFKHVIISDVWNIHNKDRSRVMPSRPDLIEEEQGIFSRVEGALPDYVHAVFDQVRARMGLDLFGMDFGIDRDGKMVLFEANATMGFAMKFGPPFEYLEKVNEPARDAMMALISQSA